MTLGTVNKLTKNKTVCKLDEDTTWNVGLEWPEQLTFIGRMEWKVQGICLPSRKQHVA